MSETDRIAIPNNILDRLDELEREVAELKGRDTTASALSEITSDFGDMVSGRFIAPSNDATSTEPTDSGFTGAFVSGGGELFDSIRAFIGSVTSGQLQAGFVEAGGIYALGSDMVIDASGLSVYGMALAQYFEATNGSETRRGYLGMNLPQGATVPAFSIIYTGPEGTNLVTNGDFETGDLTGWTDTDSAWEASTTSPQEGTYSAFHDGTLGIFGGDLQQGSLSASPSDIVVVSFYNRRAAGILAGRMKIEFLSSVPAVISTEYIYGATSSSWGYYQGVFVAPASTATVRITWEAADPFNDEYLDDVVVYVTDTLQELRFTDDGIIQYKNGVAVSSDQQPQSATLFFQTDMITSVTTATTFDASQRFGHYVGPSAANANNGDEYTFSFSVAAGTYDISIVGFTNTTSGKTDMYIDDVLVNSGMDWYSAAGTQNVTKTSSSIAVSSGRHVLKIKVNGLNASSTDYRLLATYIVIKPSAFTY